MKFLPAPVLVLCAALAACQSTPPAVSDAATALASGAAAPGAERCEALHGARLGSAVIENAEALERGEPLLSFLLRALFEVITFGALPELDAPVDFCRVTAKLRPVSGSEITAEVWLPQHWNGKLLGGGGGGFNGGLIGAATGLSKPLEKGYVGLVTDAGHGFTLSAKFAHKSKAAYEDFGYRANHVGAEFAKALAAAYYGTPVKRAYFKGCSNGGRDALMEAQRFPEDYDGIIAGAPAAGWSKLVTSFAWNWQAIQDVPDLEDKLTLVQDAVMTRCDALDGIKDGLLENPLNCDFDPAALQCHDGDGPNCLNTAEVAALRKLYGGPRLRDGTPVYAGMPVGGEGLKDNWEQWIFDNGIGQALMGKETFRWMVYGDPDWKLAQFNIDRDYPQAKERMGPLMDSDHPDLRAFTGRGGRLLLWHGWNDAAIPAGATIDYYEALSKMVGAAAGEQVRLFMVPGMTHCSGGPGPTEFDALAQLERWVESGVAPERIVASEYDSPERDRKPDAKEVRTRPLCPWPKQARYSGSGSTDDAANFTCQ